MEGSRSSRLTTRLFVPRRSLCSLAEKLTLTTRLSPSTITALETGDFVRFFFFLPSFFNLSFLFFNFLVEEDGERLRFFFRSLLLSLAFLAGDSVR